MYDIEIGQTETCIICLDNDIKKIKKYCVTHNDHLKKINCSCNVYCHSKCIKENIFIHNDGNQECIICKKEYQPLYKKKPEFNSIQSVIIGFCNFLYNLYSFSMIIIFYLIFFIISGYLFQIIKHIFNNDFISTPFNLTFLVEGTIFGFFLFLVITKFNPDNTDNIFVKVLDKYCKLLCIY